MEKENKSDGLYKASFKTFSDEPLESVRPHIRNTYSIHKFG